MQLPVGGEPGVGEGLAAGGDRELREPPRAARGASLEVVLGVEALDLAGDLDGEVVRVAERHAGDAVAAAAEALPVALDVVADRRHRAEGP